MYVYKHIHKHLHMYTSPYRTYRERVLFAPRSGSVDGDDARNGVHPEQPPPQPLLHEAVRYSSVVACVSVPSNHLREGGDVAS